MSTAALPRLQEVLRRLLRLDESVGLDFGIYRVINMKRAHLDLYLSETLPEIVAEVIGESSQQAKDERVAHLEYATARARRELGDAALDADGYLTNDAYKTTLAGAALVRAQDDALHLKTAAEMQEEIYDHLASFFSRYECGGGDIVPRRRHSSHNRYAVPHNGEEVLLHWANRDQYYIKTSAWHPAIAFRAGGNRYQMRIAEERDRPRDNNRDSGRCMLPQIDSIAAHDNGDIVIPFKFRALDKDEQARYKELANGDNGGNGNGTKVQRGILMQAAEQLRAAAASDSRLAPLMAAHSVQQGSTVFAVHADQLVRRNSADFFIHRDLQGFLSTELDFYLKSEVLNAEELASLSDAAVSSRLVAFRAIRELGSSLIAALAEWENLQKSIWEKKKFILQSEYCAALGQVPGLEESGLLQQIADCDKQWAEWQQLGMDGDAAPLFCAGGRRDRRMAWLRENPSLPVDTANFPPQFKDQLLAQFDDIDDATDGVLIHSENWQALNLMQTMYNRRVQCVHLDPPYNTNTSGFLYKNGFQHSSWMAMMETRIAATMPLLSGAGILQCHIDENEYERLRLLLEQTPTVDMGTVIWDKKNPMLAGKGIATQHEYIVLRAMREQVIYLRNKRAKQIIAKAKMLIRKHGGVNDKSRKAFSGWIAKAKDLSGGERAYSQIDDDGRVFRGVAMAWPNPSQPPEQYFVPLVHPTTGKPCPVPAGGWSQSPDKMAKLMKRGEILFGEDESTQPQKKIFLTEDSRRQLPSILRVVSRGGKDLEAMNLSFSYCHPVALYEDLLGAGASGSDLVLDYFAGSGTTAHAVVNLNREDGGRRRFILVEAGEHFGAVLLPRVKKVMYSPEWKEGRAVRPATGEESERGPRLVKYQRMESYEDALANIRFDEGGLMLEKNQPRYELAWESRHSPTRLINAGLDRPFDYGLELVTGNGGTRTEMADLPETFAWLFGLRVRTRRIIMDGDRRYLVQRGMAADKDTVVIWRDLEGWQEADYERDRKFIKGSRLAADADQLFCNGNITLKHARSLNPVFGRAMFPDAED